MMTTATFTPLRRIAHPKGDLFHVLKCGEEDFKGFGEAYFTTVLHGQAKGWKRHTVMHMNLIVPVGCVRFYVYDEKQARTTHFDLGPDNYGRLSVPPGMWVAFKGMGSELNLVLNLASIPHDPTESVNMELDRYPLGDEA